MLLDRDEMVGILRELLIRTRDDKVTWSSDGERLSVDLPNRISVTLSRNQEGVVSASVQRGQEEMGSAVFPPAESAGGREPQELYAAARETAKRSIYAEIIESIKLTGSASVEMGPSTDVPAEVKARVLKRMAGRWSLDYSRGKEVAVIHEDGAYFIEGRRDPTFRLVVLAVNEATSTVEVAKDLPDGRRRQIEYLTLAEGVMSGYAKHDGHSLTYRRLKP
jgi:hypothetical protein